MKLNHRENEDGDVHNQLGDNLGKKKKLNINKLQEFQ